METEKSNKPSKNYRSTNKWLWFGSVISLVLYFFVIIPLYLYLKDSELARQIGYQEILRSEFLFQLMLWIFVILLIFNLIITRSIFYRVFAIPASIVVYIFLSLSINYTTLGAQIPLSKCEDYKIIAQQDVYKSSGYTVFAQQGDEYTKAGYIGSSELSNGKISEVIVYRSFWQSNNLTQMLLKYEKEAETYESVYKDGNEVKNYDQNKIYPIDLEEMFLEDPNPRNSLNAFTPKGIINSDVFNPSSKIYKLEKERLENINYWQSKDLQKFANCLYPDILTNTYLSKRYYNIGGSKRD